MIKYLYQQLYRDLSDEIQRGQRAVGERMPSVRQLCQQRGISKSTVLTTYARLEAEGIIEARPRSGYFVCAHTQTDQYQQGLQSPQLSRPETTPVPVTVGQVIVDIMDKGAAFDLISAVDRSPGNEQLRRCMARAQRQQTATEQMHYNEPSGLLELRAVLAQRLAASGVPLGAEDLIITGGCQNALMLALMATTKRGDVVAIESPGFYGVIQLLELLGLKALELPSSPQHGLSPDALELAFQHWDIKAVLVSPCYSTPMGSCMPESNKQQILAMTQRRGIPIIEDDIYGELGFGPERPRTLHSYDHYGSVLLCSSFSKNLSRDLRIGWIIPGRYYQRVKQLKLITSLASSITVQKGITQFLQEGGFDRQLRLRRQQLKQQCQQLLQLIPTHLPQAISCSQPRGGLSLWVELPPLIDTLELYHQAIEQGVIITPGRLFTVQERYRNALRLSFSAPWTEARIQALHKLGFLIQAQLSEQS